MNTPAHLVLAALIGCLLAAPAPPAHAEEASAAGEGGEASEKAADTQDEADGGLEPLGPVGDHLWAFGFSPTLLFWDTPYGTRKFELLFGLHARYRGLAPLYLGATLDFARRNPTAGNLVAANNHTGALFGAGLDLWLDNYHLFGELQGGTLFRAIQLGDGRGDDYTATQVRPTAGIHYGFGVAFFQKLALHLTGGGRIYAPGRLDLHIGVRLDWLLTSP